ncbi:flagellar hook-associated family protein [Rhizobium alvei]|uniref:Flagellin n=1 Tax=Rhizobium alvei TaxID=1132659 RepID=A0ABT8YFY1_9HYPH|nr:flagellar hook-associated family protein [Rhizobium alvei]MDO6962579.1 flagellar hook-associated family protein [Rhizobium alvei]
MKTSFISNLAVQSNMRSTINSVQQDLLQTQKEIVTGQVYDVGTELGATTARSLNLHRDMSMMENLVSTNSIVTQRLSSAQMALGTMADSAQTGLNTLVALAGSTDSTQLSTAVRTLTDVIDQFTDAGNTSVNGEYLFAGINTDTKPVMDYFTDEAGAKSFFDNAFLSTFGFAQTDPAAQTIAPADLQAFIDDLETSFMGSDWNTNWSTASDTPMTSRISQTEVVQTSSSINANGFRYLALASVIGVELLNTSLTSDARAIVSNAAISYMGQAINGIDNERSQLGLSENRVSIANEALSSQIDIVKLNLDDLEGIDVYEASTRITALTNQMEISYNLTARISELSLVNEL